MSRWSAIAGAGRRVPGNADFADLLETVLVAAVATILVIRTQLWLTHYPQLGGHGLHIAHLLYGGFLMLLAIGIDLVAGAARRPFGEHEKRRALEWLRGADEAGPLVEPMRRAVMELE